MAKIKISKDAGVLFIKCRGDSFVLDRIPNYIINNQFPKDDPFINSICYYNNVPVYLDLSGIESFTSRNKQITLEEYGKTVEKYMIITVELGKEDIINLQYILILEEYFRTSSINVFLILHNEDDINIYFKISQYFSTKHTTLYNAIFIKDADGIKKLPSKYNDFLPGEILPFFRVDEDFYRSCYDSFHFNEVIYDKIGYNRKMILTVLSSFGYSPAKIYLYFCIYSYLTRLRGYEKVIDFIKFQRDTPLLAMLLFGAVVSKKQSDSFDYGLVFESCLDYALSLEQIVENTFFYASDGILSFRIHKGDSKALIDVMKPDQRKPAAGFFIEVTLVDYCPDGTIVSNFIDLADEDRQPELQSELDAPNALERILTPNISHTIDEYFNNPKMIIEHYGLQTLHLMAKKTEALFCLKNKQYFYSDTQNPFFKAQAAEKYHYAQGTFYRLVIPIREQASKSVYSGISKNNYKFSYLDFGACSLKIDYSQFDLPDNRQEKSDRINQLTRLLTDNYEEGKILCLSALTIKRRIEAEYLIKAVLSFLSKQDQTLDAKKSVCVAITEFQNMGLLKTALRLIALCYTYRGENTTFLQNELFLCNLDCSAEIFISGKKYDDILKNLVSQLVFGAINDEIFDELNTSVSTLERNVAEEDEGETR